MTIPRNFPHRKYQRRVSALARLEKCMMANPLETDEQKQKFLLGEKEAAILEERTKKGGGRVSTKKVGSNIGRNF